MSADEDALIAAHPDMDARVVRHILNMVCGGNRQIAAETLPTLTPDVQRQIIESIAAASGELTTHQKNLIANFRSITGVKRRVASRYMERNAWRLEEAINSFYESGALEAQSFGEGADDETSLDKMWEKYKVVGREDDDEEPEPDEEEVLGPEAIIEMCTDLEIDPNEDVMILVVAWLLKAQSTYTITKTEFMDGFDMLACDSLEDIKACLPKWRQKLGDKNSFRQFYRFVFGFSVKTRSMDPAIATALWRLLFKGRVCEILEDWCTYIAKVYKKAITRDTWNQFADFCDGLDAELTQYNADDCWPYIMDEFVEWFRGGKEIPPPTPPPTDELDEFAGL